MIVFILTDMEGVAGIDHWDQCYDPDDNSPKYRYGREQLTLDLNATVAGAFDGGATEVRVLDGHGRNNNKGFIPELVDQRIRKCWIDSRDPLRWEGIGPEVNAVAVIGQHAMAGTINGFLDHTQRARVITRLLINGQEHGELSQCAAYFGHYGTPLVFTSGDEALCEETRRLFPWARTAATKQGTGWATCELFPLGEVRANIRREMAAALRELPKMKPWKLSLPIDVGIEFNCSELCDQIAKVPGVRRPTGRLVQWRIGDARDIYSIPHTGWLPVR
ncbi:MAG: M55 family metallopeptidase [Phycisphaeraceae bacterium]|nr:M55 family metallopeptidase [Phycisphaeraceae bacterium]